MRTIVMVIRRERNDHGICTRPCTECDTRTRETMRRNRIEMLWESQRRNSRWQ
jgi:hypothetical protein